MDALQPVASPIQYNVEDYVRICDDLKRVELLQHGHGGWTDEMLPSLGKIGQIAGRFESDLQVAVDGELWIFNPLAVERAFSSADKNGIAAPCGNDTGMRLVTTADNGSRLRMKFSAMLKGNFGNHSNSVHDQLLHRTVTGDTARVEQLLKRATHIDLNCPVGRAGQQKIALQAASQYGQVDILKVYIYMHAVFDMHFCCTTR